jgi:hypothetical protein
MAKEMRKMATRNAAWATWFAAAGAVVKRLNPKASVSHFSFELGRIFDGVSSSDLESVMESYKALLDALQPLRHRPVIVIGVFSTAELLYDLLPPKLPSLRF